MKKKNKYIIYAFFVFILSLLCLFYIFAKGVNINVFPSEASSEAEISLKGGISFSFKNRFIVLPGEKTLTVKAKGYFQEEKKINVFSNMLIDVNLKELPGEVTFNISPEEGSFLYIDDKKIIDADIPISLKAGLHRIKVKNPKYLKYEDEVLVKGKGINQIKSINLNSILRPIILQLINKVSIIALFLSVPKFTIASPVIPLSPNLSSTEIANTL